MVSVRRHLSQLRSLLASGAEIVTPDQKQRYAALMQRWTDIGKKYPGAIILLVTEAQIHLTVTENASP